MPPLPMDRDTGSTLTHLQCSACGRQHDADRLQTLCPDCGNKVPENALRCRRCGHRFI